MGCRPHFEATRWGRGLMLPKCLLGSAWQAARTCVRAGPEEGAGRQEGEHHALTSGHRGALGTV